MVPDQLEYSVMKRLVVYHTVLILIPYFILEDILIITENNMAVAARMLRLRLSSVNPCKSLSKRPQSSQRNRKTTTDFTDLRSFYR